MNLVVDLVRVGKAFLDKTAAIAYQRGLNAGGGTGVTSSFRDPAEQQHLRTLYLAGNYPAYVAPVEKSDHVKGLAIDLPPADRAWWRANGREYGWLFTDPTESWHMAYRIAYDQHLNDNPPPTPAKENDMPLEQSDLEAIDRVIAGQLDGRLRERTGTKVPATAAGVIISQAGKEELDRMIANRMDERFSALNKKLDAIIARL